MLRVGFPLWSDGLKRKLWTGEPRKMNLKNNMGKDIRGNSPHHLETPCTAEVLPQSGSPLFSFPSPYFQTCRPQVIRLQNNFRQPTRVPLKTLLTAPSDMARADRFYHAT
jgi:hypothetical protein